MIGSLQHPTENLSQHLHIIEVSLLLYRLLVRNVVFDNRGSDPGPVCNSDTTVYITRLSWDILRDL